MWTTQQTHFEVQTLLSVDFLSKIKRERNTQYIEISSTKTMLSTWRENKTRFYLLYIDIFFVYLTSTTMVNVRVISFYKPEQQQNRHFEVIHFIYSIAAVEFLSNIKNKNST